MLDGIPDTSLGTAEGLDASVRASLPTWTGQDGRYHYTMVGSDPGIREGVSSNTKLKAEIFPLVVKFEDTGAVFDPRAADPTCSPAGSALALTLQSPVFRSTTISPGGTSIGSGEYPTDLFQRANFYDDVSSPQAINPHYGVTLDPVVERPIDIAVPSWLGVTTTIGCGRFGVINAAVWDLTGVINNLKSLIRPDDLPVFLLYNVGFYVDSDPDACCVIAYHAAFDLPKTGGLQTYVVADYDTSGAFTGVADITALGDAIANWEDDPTGQNPTPPWGNECQANLEVADPLEGVDFPVTMPNGFTYHPPDLAFKSWFFGDTPSSGVNGWYSFVGTLRTPAAQCS
jgi:hypothetical protein